MHEVLPRNLHKANFPPQIIINVRHFSLQVSFSASQSFPLFANPFIAKHKNAIARFASLLSLSSLQPFKPNLFLEKRKMSWRDDKPIFFYPSLSFRPFIIAKFESNVKDEDFKYSPPTKDANIRKFSLGSSAPIVRSQFNDAFFVRRKIDDF